jgi:hypothetical protein
MKNLFRRLSDTYKKFHPTKIIKTIKTLDDLEEDMILSLVERQELHEKGYYCREELERDSIEDSARGLLLINTLRGLYSDKNAEKKAWEIVRGSISEAEYRLGRPLANKFKNLPENV